MGSREVAYFRNEAVDPGRRAFPQALGLRASTAGRDYRIRATCSVVRRVDRSQPPPLSAGDEEPSARTCARRRCRSLLRARDRNTERAAVYDPCYATGSDADHRVTSGTTLYRGSAGIFAVSSLDSSAADQLTRYLVCRCSLNAVPIPVHPDQSPSTGTDVADDVA